MMRIFGEQTYFSLKYSSGNDTPDMIPWVRLTLDDELPNLISLALAFYITQSLRLYLFSFN